MGGWWSIPEIVTCKIAVFGPALSGKSEFLTRLTCDYSTHSDIDYFEMYHTRFRNVHMSFTEIREPATDKAIKFLLDEQVDCFYVIVENGHVSLESLFLSKQYFYYIHTLIDSHVNFCILMCTQGESVWTIDEIVEFFQLRFIKNRNILVAILNNSTRYWVLSTLLRFTADMDLAKEL